MKRVLILHEDAEVRQRWMAEVADEWEMVSDHDAPPQGPVVCERVCDGGHHLFEHALRLVLLDRWVVCCASVCCLPAALTDRATHVVHGLSARETRYMRSRLPPACADVCPVRSPLG